MGEEVVVKKPLIDESLRVSDSCEIQTNVKSLNGISWPSSSWQDGSRRSAFQPYRPTTILTNLQRGNIQTNTPHSADVEVTWFEKAGRGDLNIQDIKDVLDINIPDQDGLTALMWAASFGQFTTVQRLLQSGADVHIKGQNDETALHLAASGGHHDVINILIARGADVNAVDCEGNTPLIFAVYGDHSHSVNELLTSGGDITMVNIYDQNPFSIAVEANSLQAQLVLELHLFALLISK